MIIRPMKYLWYLSTKPDSIINLTQEIQHDKNPKTFTSEFEW